MIKKLLISGCSYTEFLDWPKRLFAPENYRVYNQARVGVGNEYIACSILHHLDTQPDFVFVLWSGINRIDMRVPNTKIFDDWPGYRSVSLGNSKFFCLDMQ